MLEIWLSCYVDWDDVLFSLPLFCILNLILSNDNCFYPCSCELVSYDSKWTCFEGFTGISMQKLNPCRVFWLELSFKLIFFLNYRKVGILWTIRKTELMKGLGTSGDHFYSGFFF